MGDIADSRKGFLTAWPALLIVALLVRGGFLLATPHALESDPDGYRALAQNLVERGIFGYGETPTAYRPPLYPLILTPLVALGDGSTAAIGILHVVLGVATVGLAYRLANLWGLERLSVVAAGLVAVDPLLLMQSTIVMTETLAVFLAVLALIGLTLAAKQPTTARTALAGFAVALASLCRPTFLPWMALGALVLPWYGLTRTDRLRTFAVYCLAAAVVLAPWVVRNQVRFGRPIAGTTHGGYTLLLANNRLYYDHLRREPWRSVWPADALNEWWLTRASRATPADELGADQLAYDEAIDTIRREPEMFLYSSLLRVAWLWSPLPHQTDPQEGTPERFARWAVGAWYVAELLLAALGMAAVFFGWKDQDRGGPHPMRHTGWIWGVFLLLVFTAVHTLFWTNIRMRAPLMPVVAAAAVYAASHLRGRVVS